jgi:Tfp pilus assembly protein PilF
LIYTHRRQPDEAEKYFKRAVEINPEAESKLREKLKLLR